MEEKKKPQFRVSEYSISNNPGRGLITITFASVDAHRTPEAFGEFIGQVARWCEQQDSMEIADAINQAYVQSKTQKRSCYCWRTITAWMGSEKFSFFVSVLAIMSLVISVVK